MEDITPEKLFEIAERNMKRGDFNRALHYYNLVLKNEPRNIQAYFKISEAYIVKAEKEDRVFYKLAMESLRKILKINPENESAHEKLMLMAFRLNELGDLAIEYREKLKKYPQNSVYKKYLNRIYIFSLLDKKINLPAVGYKPVLFVKVFFDLITLPSSILFIMASFFGLKYRHFLYLGEFIFFWYLCYRFIIYFLSKRS